MFSVQGIDYLEIRAFNPLTLITAKSSLTILMKYYR